MYAATVASRTKKEQDRILSPSCRKKRLKSDKENLEKDPRSVRSSSSNRVEVKDMKPMWSRRAEMQKGIEDDDVNDGVAAAGVGVQYETLFCP